MAICEACKKEAGVIKYDDSFDSEFGTEERHHFGSECCDADVYSELCPDCKGTGKASVGTMAYATPCDCDNCDGKGMIGLQEVTCEDDLIDWDARRKDEF